jgi:hypothetical protein
MKKKNLSVFFALCIAVICGAGCSDNWSFTSKAVIPAVVPGKIVGYVGLRDERGGGILDTGVTVTLSNANPVKSVSADIRGRFQLDSIPPGAYDLTYEKPGYGTYKAFGFVLPGGATAVSAGKINLVKVASAVVDSLTVDTSAADHILFTAFIRPSLGDSAVNAARFFVGMDDPNVSSTNYAFGDADYGTTSYNAVNHTIQYCLPVSQVSGYVVKNLPLYAVAYGAPEGESAYFDITAGVNVWPALSLVKSNVVSFQVH